jgi:DNA-binding transcriptional MerR regulator
MPVTYADLTSRDQTWSLDAFVAEINRLLPEVVPSEAGGRAKLEVNARLVRHYATEGVLPKPLKEAGEARYDTDHLVRLLALRRLLAEGFASSVAGAFLRRHDREKLARFLLGELKLDLDLAPGGLPVVEAPEDGAISRLNVMRARASLPPLGARSAPDEDVSFPLAMSAPPTYEDDEDDLSLDPRGVSWTRYPLLPALELHVRDDFEDPATPAAQNTMRDAILDRLAEILLERERHR